MLLRFFALQGRCLYIFRRPLYQIPKYTPDTRQTDGKIMPVKAVFEKERGILKQVV